jgi:hypothetical protein
VCNCPYIGDPNRDGFSTVVDVVLAVGVAFRNDPFICNDCTPEGRAELTDVNCDGNTTITDVVKIVAVTFRNADPAIEYCNPCDTPPPSTNCP